MKNFCLGFACGAGFITAAVFFLAWMHSAQGAPVKVACYRSTT
ncbi:MAG: hypothetical protein GAK35_02637 [Herbaspirillum frisingense]|uniref:Uncharacterized protein n=1 Tax=Herbaspirillum frisingense TaxID=92645 RepID=A0A7V8JTV3_9BURK|nr:MAG: hypothetical protein GAK35_02637 [Herbaspirillum frisingense]